MNIVCRKTKCKHNHNLACMSKQLLIDSKLNCEFFEPIEDKSVEDISKQMMEIAPEIAPFRHSREVDISCEANCVFNNSGKCMANGIFVSGQTKRANKNIENIVNNDENHKKSPKKSFFLKFGKKNSKSKDKATNENRLNKIGDEKDSSTYVDIKKIERECTNCDDYDISSKDENNAKCFTFASK